MSAEKVDPFFPQAWGDVTNVDAEKVDKCLMHPQIQGIFHYHFMPVCLADSSIGASAGRCDGECASDLI